MPLFRLVNIIRRYSGRVVLSLPRFEARAGEILGITGRNGSGKSTLLRLLALLEAPDEGQIFLDGQPADANSLAQRRQVTLLLQTPYLLSRSVQANVTYGLLARGMDAANARAAANDALRAVGLDPAIFAARRRHELSGGEAQRVALAARLALKPRALLMDEPTASVDEESAARIAAAAREAAGRGAAVIVVSHDRDWLDPLAHRLVRLASGSVLPSPCAAPTPLPDRAGAPVPAD